ncbi:MAG: efflux RND transporter periplasmic adaptor subunit [Betaproteobacteria bacterium]
MAVALAGCSQPGNGVPQTASTVPGNVKLTDAQRQHIHVHGVAPSKFHKTTVANGVVDFDSDQATSVIAAFSGPVKTLLVAPGDRVRKGDPLAEVVSSDFAAAINAYKKGIATADNNRRLADVDKDLVQHNGVSQREALQAETDAVSAEGDRDAALQALLALGVDPKVIKDIREGRTVTHTEGLIRAPIAGTVAERLITPGQLLQAGTTPCFTIADLSRVWVMTQVFGADLASVKVGDPAEIDTGSDATRMQGKVDNISSLVDPTTRAVSVRVVVENPHGLLRKQMYVRVLIRSLEESTGLLVQTSAILHDDENLPFVYVAQADGSFARTHVTLGYRLEDQYEITEGLKPGDQVMTDGGVFVQFMQNQ